MEILCHFTDSKSAKKILESCALKFGKVHRSNDPLEMKDRFIHSAMHDEYEELNVESINHLKKILSILCFSSGDFDFENIFDKDDFLGLSNIDRPVFTKPRMWAQYGNTGDGVCFIFDKKKIIQEFKTSFEKSHHIIHDDIQYDNVLSYLPNIDANILEYFSIEGLRKYKDIGAVHTFLEKKGKEVYFLKDNDWKDEDEFRFLCWNKKENKSNRRMFLDISNCLVGVVLGIDSTLEIELLDDNRFLNVVKMQISYDVFYGLYKVK